MEVVAADTATAAISIAGAIVLLSDLHLPEGGSSLRSTFVDFIDGPARQASGVYLLGDIFEYWIGDDVGIAAHRTEIDALRRLTAAGVPLWVMQGNRDFLLGDGFLEATGARLLADPSVVDIAGRKVLLSHGDLFCTADAGYQRWRRFSRKPLLQQLFRRLPVGLRLKIAGSLRAQSGEATRRKAMDRMNILDVEPVAVAQALRESGVDLLIHGHTHRPGVHALIVDGRPARRHVLADWRSDTMQITVATPDGVLRRLELPIATA